MRILVTGGAGFIGSHMVEFLINKGHEVILVDDLSTGKLNNIKHLLKEIEFVEKKVEDIDLNAFKNIDSIIHLAAQASVPLSISEFKQSSSTNILSSICILDFCARKNIPLVYASSSAVYGEMEIGEDRGGDVDLLSPYAVDKYILELYSKVLEKIFDLSSIGLRFFNVYGPKQDPSNPYSGVISIFVDRTLNQLPIYVNGGQQTRDFIYVNDVVNGIYKSLEIVQSKTVCETINILTGKEISIDYLADLISEQIKFQPQKIYKPLPVGDPEKSSGTTTKQKKLLGMDTTSFTSIEEGLKATIDFIKFD